MAGCTDATIQAAAPPTVTVNDIAFAKTDPSTGLTYQISSSNPCTVNISDVNGYTISILVDVDVSEGNARCDVTLAFAKDGVNQSKTLTGVFLPVGSGSHISLAYGGSWTAGHYNNLSVTISNITAA